MIGLLVYRVSPWLWQEVALRIEGFKPCKIEPGRYKHRWHAYSFSRDEALDIIGASEGP